MTSAAISTAPVTIRPAARLASPRPQRRRRPCLACDPALVALGCDAALIMLNQRGVDCELFPLCRECKHAGVVYLIHFVRPYKHARHYLGWTRRLEARLFEHDLGRGARLMQVIHAAGIGWQLARLWPGDRHQERALKARHGSTRFCPLCGVRPRPVAGEVRGGQR